MMKVPPLSLVGMERLPLPLPFSPELLWRYNPLGPPSSSHHHSQAAAAAAVAAASPSVPPSSSAAAVTAAAAAFTRAAAAAAASSMSSPIQQQLPFAYDIKTTIPIRLAASDPRLWNREDVAIFLQWCEREFDLPSFDMDRFQMNGKALCLLTKADLESRAPCSGDVIHNALQLLMTSGDSPLTPHTPSSLRIPQLGNGKTWSMTDLQQYAAAQQQQGTTSVTLSPAPSLDGQAGSPQDHANGQTSQHLSSASSSGGSGGPPSDDSEYDSVGESPERSPPVQSMSPPPTSHGAGGNSHSANGGHHHHHSHHHSNSSNGNSAVSSSNGSNGNGVGVAAKSSFSPASKLGNGAAGGAETGEYNNNGRLLWDFLQQLLNDPAQRYSNFIAWKNVDTGIFKIVDPPGLARLWGIQKNHLSMNYDKMSRALRYYYRVNILRKVQGERHCYQFLRNPGELKSIKNISMLRHQQNSPMSLSVKPDAGSYGNDSNGNGNDYEPPSKYSLLSHHQQSSQQHSNSPVSLTVKSEPLNYGGGGSSPDDYESKLAMLGHRQQSSPVSLTTKNCSTSPSSSSSSSNGGGGAPGGDSYGDDYDSMNGHHLQDSPMPLTTKSSNSDHHHHHHPDNESSVDSRGGGHRSSKPPQHSPVSLTVKSEPTPAFITPDDDYEDVPTDLSMDTDRDRQSKDDD